MNLFFKSIETLNIHDFKNNLSHENIQSTCEGYGPLEFLLNNMTEDKNIHIALIISQELINNGCDILDIQTKEISFENTDSKKKRLYNYIISGIRYAPNIPLENNVNKCSNYSKQELLQLQKYAQKYGLRANENHLALRIIQYLEKSKVCSNCLNN